MENTVVSPHYEKYFSLSIRGASHYKSGKPMQDYSMACRCEDHCIGIVCDGHGSDKHFRSEVGSELATKVAFEKLSAVAQSYPTWESFNCDLPEKLERLRLSIMAGWQNAVEAYTQENPFTEDELTKASGTFKSRRTFDVGNPYGTTLLATLMCRDYYLVVMLGDGAIMKILPGSSDNPALNATGEMVKFEGKNAFDDAPHGATDSMCSVDAYYNIFFGYDEIDPERDHGLLFALGSDGISEAFPNDAGLVREFMIHYGNFVQVGLEQALEDSQARLDMLSQKSAAHDDISIAYVTFSDEAYIPVVEEPEEEEQEVIADAEEVAQPAEEEEQFDPTEAEELPDQPQEQMDGDVVSPTETVLPDEFEANEDSLTDGDDEFEEQDDTLVIAPDDDIFGEV